MWVPSSASSSCSASVWCAAPLKWALAAATLLSFLFAWGHNFMAATDFFIDVLPMYSKFRTVSSALVIAEFTMPVLAMLALAEVIRHPEKIFGTRRGKVSLGVAAVLTVGVSLFYALVPDAANLLSSTDQQAFAQLQQFGVPADFINGYKGALLSLHAAILRPPLGALSSSLSSPLRWWRLMPSGRKPFLRLSWWVCSSCSRSATSGTSIVAT